MWSLRANEGFVKKGERKNEPVSDVHHHDGGGEWPFPIHAGRQRGSRMEKVQGL